MIEVVRITLKASANSEPPKEFQIFSAGKVETSKGTFVFDKAAAKSVMASYAKHGADLMIDYDHASLSDAPPDPAQAGKAAGWFDLELRNGELWAVNVRWTAPADAALRAKEWRYMSPAFATKDGRVTSLLNVAITNLPATRNLKPLMAASAAKDPKMATPNAKPKPTDPNDPNADPNAAPAGDDAPTLAPDATCQDFADALEAAGLDAETPLADALDQLGYVPDDAPPSSAEGGPPSSSQTIASGATKHLLVVAKMLGGKSVRDSLTEVLSWRTSHERLAKLDVSARRSLYADLVKLAGRSPASVWADDTATTPKTFLENMSTVDLVAYVDDAIKAHGGRPQAMRGSMPRVPTGASAGHDQFGNTPEQVALCAELGTNPADFAVLRKQRDGAKAGVS